MKEFIIKVDTKRIQRFMDEQGMNRFQFADYCKFDGLAFFAIMHFWTEKKKDALFKISKAMNVHVYELFIIEHIDEGIIDL